MRGSVAGVVVAVPVGGVVPSSGDGVAVPRRHRKQWRERLQFRGPERESGLRPWE